MLKNINFKSLIIGVVLGGLLVSAVPVSAAVKEYIFTESNTKIIVNGEEYKTTAIPIYLFSYNNRNFISLTFVNDLCKKVGATFNYDNTSNIVQINTSNAISTTTKPLTKSSISLTTTNPNTTTTTPDSIEIGGSYYKNPPKTILPSNMEWYLYSPSNDDTKFWCIKYNGDIYMNYVNALLFSGCKQTTKYIQTGSSKTFNLKIKTEYYITNGNKSVLFNKKDTSQYLELNDEYLNYSWLLREFN